VEVKVDDREGEIKWKGGIIGVCIIGSSSDQGTYGLLLRDRRTGEIRPMVFASKEEKHSYFLEMMVE
jgi:hypothetical protein